MITILHGGGSLGTPKSDYVICARPLVLVYRNQWAQSESWFRLHFMIAASFSVDKGLHKSVNITLWRAIELSNINSIRSVCN